MDQSIVENVYFADCPTKSCKAKAVLACTRVARCFQAVVQRVALALLIVAFLSIVLSPGTLQAATITTASCSYADVSAAVKSAQNGDTVLIPPGTCTWTTSGLGSNCGFTDQDTSFCNPDNTNKYITIQGAGIGQTIIIDNVPRNIPGSNVVFQWRLNGNGLSRITGIEFHGAVFSLDCNHTGSNTGLIGIHGSSSQFRFDHNKIVTDGGCMGINVGGSNIVGDSYLRGVLDHNFFDVSSENGYCAYVFNGQSWGDVGIGGDNSWAQPDTVGTAEAIFFEDNTFYFNQASGHPFYFCIDGWQGGRAVFRSNHFQATQLGNHGTDSGVRSQRQYEIYNNSFEGPGGGPLDLKGQTVGHFISSRGGVAVVANNTFTTTNGTLQYAFEGGNFRSGYQASPIYGMCTGSNPWDQNSTSAGWRCLDQIGVGYGHLLDSSVPIDKVTGTQVWPQQVAQPNYVWNNTKNGVIFNSNSTTPTAVIVGRDIIDGVVRPGWTPYQYPHPLATGATTSGTAPPPPTGLHVQ